MANKNQYPEILMDFVVLERTKGTEWLSIQDKVKEVFKTKPPSIRQMRNWVKRREIMDYKIRYLAPVYDSSLGKYAEALGDTGRLGGRLNEVLLHSVLVSLLSTMMEASSYGFDPVEMAGVEIMASMERVVGREKYDRMLKRFQSIRDSNKIDKPGKNP